MTTPSNLYAEKVYAEHPTLLWALDDKADYVSLISESQRSIENFWTTSGGTASDASSISNQPFQDSILNLLEGNVPIGEFDEIESIGPNLVNFLSLNQDYSTFAVGGFIYSISPYITSFSIGYEYTDTSTGVIIQNLKTFPVAVTGSWMFVSETFEIPQENTTLRPVIKIKYSSGGLLSSDYTFYVNGITVGQWAEEFNAASLGVETSLTPSTIAIQQSQSVEAEAYGLGGDSGYYLSKDHTLTARNTGVPMVFGGSGVTRLSPNDNLPSLMVPGQGFLNQAGQFKEYTVEFWIRINSSTYSPKKIFGPISSSDGLYVESGFLTLVIGNKFASHFVGEWFRPMLVHIRLINNAISMLINGEQVLSINIETASLSLPSILDENGDNQDWLGFYAYEDVNPIELDCIAIYNYQVPVTVAKRRWVYGQGVVSPENINTAYAGTSAFIDYPFADYTSDYTYPNFAQWQQGTFDNLTTNNFALTAPQYTLPDINLGTKTLEQLYIDNKDIQDPLDYNFITFRPDVSWNSENCYFNFNRLNILNDQIHSIYGVFSSGNLSSEEILIKIYNTLTGNSFSIRKDVDEIHYYLTFNGIEEEIYTTPAIIADEKFAAGIEINKLSEYFGGNVTSFFGNQNGLKIYVGGDESEIYQFTGKIYSFGLSTNYNASQISNHFDENGIAIFDDMSSTSVVEPENALALLNHTASYTLLPLQAYDTYFLDIGVSGYWEDYMPLSYFAQYVKNDVGNSYYDLDFLQFNIGYPKPSNYYEVETTSSWTYGELFNEYNNPIHRTYAELDNFLFTGWNNYEDMSQKAVKYYEYNTQGANIRSYLTFQYILDGANAPMDTFTTIEPAKAGSVIDLSEYPSWDTTKFEVVDDTVIYPSNQVDFKQLAVVYHLDFNVRGILTKPIALKRLELASQAFNSNSFNPVGTRFGVNLFPYTRSGFYYDYKAKNPFSIYKGSTPYLYLTRNSGIEVRGEYDPLIERGIVLPINSGIADDYKVSAMQMWMRYDQDQFPGTPVQLFQVDYKEDTIVFYMVANSETGNRAKVFAKSKNTGLDYEALSYYLNGTLVKDPVLTIKEWSVLGVAFASALSYDSYLGAINLNGQMLFNNVSYYQANNLQQVQSVLNRPWLKVKTDGVTNYDWEYWDNNFSWNGVLIISASDLYSVNPSDVYKTYIGTNKIIIDDEEGLSIDADNLSIYSDVTWAISVGTPV